MIAIAAGYVIGQYRTAQQPASLASIPQYPYRDSAYPLDAVAPSTRAAATTTLRAFANTAVPNYHPSSELLLAAKGVFVWDAIRSAAGSYLSDKGFEQVDAGQTPEAAPDLAYITWARRSPLQKLFSRTQILAVGLHTPVRTAPADQQVHLYGYFALAPNN